MENKLVLYHLERQKEKFNRNEFPDLNEQEFKDFAVEGLYLHCITSVISIFENVDFDDIDFYASCFNASSFTNCNFIDVNFTKSELNQITLVSCTFTGCRFFRAEIQSSNITDCTFMNCNFEDILFCNNIVSNSNFTILTDHNSLIDENTEDNVTWNIIDNDGEQAKTIW